MDPYPFACGSRGDVYEAYLDSRKVSLPLLVLVCSWQLATACTKGCCEGAPRFSYERERGIESQESTLLPLAPSLEVLEVVIAPYTRIVPLEPFEPQEYRPVLWSDVPSDSPCSRDSLFVYPTFTLGLRRWPSSRQRKTGKSRLSYILKVVHLLCFLRDVQLWEVAVGIAYLHSKYVIHGDLKPVGIPRKIRVFFSLMKCASQDNVRVSADGQVKIIDLGMGKLENVQGFTSMWGPNPRYSAPELLGAEGGIRPTFKTDVYSFAMMTLSVRNRSIPCTICHGLYIISLPQVLHGPDPDPAFNFDSSMPFNEIGNGLSATLGLCELVCGGRRPRQTRYRNITQEQWNFMEVCWHQDPKKRPGMDHIVKHFPFEPYPS